MWKRPVSGSGMDIAQVIEPLKRLRDERGQAVTEYAVVVFFTVMVVVLASVVTFQVALLDYFQDVASLIALPIP